MMSEPQSPRSRALTSSASGFSSGGSARASSPERDSRFALGRSLASLPRSGHRDVAAPEADAAASHAVGEGLRCQVLHRPARFSIFACDRFRRHLRTGGDPFTVSIRGPSLVWPSLNDCEDGTYECEWQASVSGTYLVTVLLHGEHIAGSPWPARAIAPGADPQQCRVRAGTSPIHATAGEGACFDLEFFDALGEGVAMEPLEMEAVLRTAEACAVRVTPEMKKKRTKRGGTGGASSPPPGSHADYVEASPERLYLLMHAVETPETYPERKCRAAVTVEKAGEYRLHVLMQPNHQPLQGSPLTLHVRPGAACAAHSKCLATSSERRMRAGQRRTFLVRTYDAFGNRCDMGGARLALSVPESVSCSVVDKGNGLYEVEWSSTLSGLYDVSILIDGVPLSFGSPLTLSVEPNELCVGKTTVEGELNHAIAGERAVVRVHGRDQFGNSVLPSPDVGFGISLRGKDSRQPVEMQCGEKASLAQPLATDHYAVGPAAGGATGERLPRATLNGFWLSDGVFELVYTCSGTGGYLLHLWYRDPSGGVHELANSPQALEVSPASADSRGTTLLEGHVRLSGETLMAGTRLSAFVQVADRFGNAREPEPSELEVILDGPKGSRKRLSLAGWQGKGEPFGAAGELKGSGTFEISEELGASGTYRLNALIFGEHAVGSPLELSVCPAPPDGETSILVPPPSAAVAHEPTTFVVQPRDRWGNPPPPAELEQAVAVGSVVARVDGPSRPKCAVRARNDGSLDVTVLVQLSGDYRLHVWIGGTQLPACPFPLRVHANRTVLEGGLADALSYEDALRSPRALANKALASPRAAATGASASGVTSRRKSATPRSSPNAAIPRYNLDRSLRATTPGRETPLDGGDRSSLVFSPRTAADQRDIAPAEVIQRPASARHGWPAGGGADSPRAGGSTPRARAAAAAAREVALAKERLASRNSSARVHSSPPVYGSPPPSARGTKPLGSPLISPRTGGQTRTGLGQSYSTSALGNGGTSPSPGGFGRWSEERLRARRVRRTFQEELEARGAPTASGVPRSAVVREEATPDFWTPVH